MAITQLWTEKYRPNSLDGYVFVDDQQKSQIQKWISEGSIPHLLFSGNAGVGKTTLAKILIEQLGVQDVDVLTANGSKEARKIEWVDDLISFCQTIPWGDFKVVLIDEADYMNIQSVQPALRNLMEDYSDSVRFILTCNYPNRILTAIHSRCQGFHIPKIDHVEFTARVATILVTEDVIFDLETLDSYVKATYPDLRKCLNLVQPNCIDGKLLPPSSSSDNVTDFKLSMVELFKQGKIREARQLICSQATSEEMEGIFRWCYDNLDIWSKTDDGKDEAIKIIRKGLVNHSLCGDAEINLSATITELSQISE